MITDTFHTFPSISDHIQPICLPLTKNLRSAEVGSYIITGWGTTEENKLSLSLKKATILAVSGHDKCRRLFAGEQSTPISSVRYRRIRRLTVTEMAEDRWVKRCGSTECVSYSLESSRTDGVNAIGQIFFLQEWAPIWIGFWPT